MWVVVIRMEYPRYRNSTKTQLMVIKMSTLRRQQKQNDFICGLFPQYCLPFPFPFFESLDGAKIVDAMLLRTVRGVDGILPPKMSLLPPPGGLSTLENKKKRNRLVITALEKNYQTLLKRKESTNKLK